MNSITQNTLSPVQIGWNSLLQKLVHPENQDKVAAKKLNNTAHLLRKEGKNEEAILAFMDAVASDPENIAYSVDLAQILRELKNPALAAQVGKHIVTLDPFNAEAHFLIAGDFWNSGEKEEALVSLELAIMTKPTYREAYEKLGCFLMSLDRFEEACEIFKAQLEFDGENPQAYKLLAFTLVKLERFDEAVEVFCAAIERLPTVAGLYYTFGSLLYKLGRNVESLLALKKAIELEPDDFETLELIAIVFTDFEERLDEASKKNEKSFIDVMRRAEDLINEITKKVKSVKKTLKN